MSDIPDLSTLFSIINQGNSNNKSTEEILSTIMSSSASSSEGTPDMETILKIMRVINSSNNDSPSKDLLKSLKPFLNENRQDKVDKYIRILGMTKAIELFNELGDAPK